LKRTALKRVSPLKRGARLRQVGKRGRAIGDLLRAVRPFVLGRDRHLCQRCKSALCKPLEVHHRRSRAQGGGHTPDNLVTLGKRCHAAVTDKSAPDWQMWVVTRKGRAS
jgi:5-methylcytosine-specific restriction endonuclease McrA